MQTKTPSSSTSELKASLKLIEIKPGKQFSLATLKSLLPDIETLLFFAKVYNLDPRQLGSLIHEVFKTPLSTALFAEGHQHSNVLQTYLIGGTEHDEECSSYYGDPCDCIPIVYAGVVGPAEAGQIVFEPTPPKGEILPQVWESLEVDVVDSIKAVAEKLETVVDKLPGKQGEMVFKSMMMMNAKRPTLGDHRAAIQHARQKRNLLIFDVSGSMSEHTVRTIVNDVVALSYKANAAMAIVSNNTFYWDEGTYDADAILAQAQFGGTQYETLHELMQMSWGTVITVADYDSSQAAKKYLKDNCHGHIDELLDVSLVNQPTFLAECVGQFADKVRPILIGHSPWVMTA